MIRRFVASVILGMSLLAEAGERETGLTDLKKGMTKSQVEILVGQPMSTRRRDTCWGTEERWSYTEIPELAGKVILFVDGKLDRIEPEKSK